MSKGERFLTDWLRHRNVLLKLLERIPEEGTGFKPWDGAMSLGDLAVHIAGAGDTFVSGVKTGAFSRPEKPVVATMAEVRELAHDLTARSTADIRSLSDERWDAVVDATQLFGLSAPGKLWLNLMLAHEIHHVGQLFLYARMVGAENLPFWVDRG